MKTKLFKESCEVSELVDNHMESPSIEEKVATEGKITKRLWTHFPSTDLNAKYKF